MEMFKCANVLIQATEHCIDCTINMFYFAYLRYTLAQSRVDSLPGELFSVQKLCLVFT